MNKSVAMLPRARASASDEETDAEVVPKNYLTFSIDPILFDDGIDSRSGKKSLPPQPWHPITSTGAGKPITTEASNPWSVTYQESFCQPSLNEIPADEEVQNTFQIQSKTQDMVTDGI